MTPDSVVLLSDIEIERGVQALMSYASRVGASSSNEKTARLRLALLATEASGRGLDSPVVLRSLLYLGTKTVFDQIELLQHRHDDIFDLNRLRNGLVSPIPQPLRPYGSVFTSHVGWMRGAVHSAQQESMNPTNDPAAVMNGVARGALKLSSVKIAVSLAEFWFELLDFGEQMIIESRPKPQLFEFLDPGDGTSQALVRWIHTKAAIIDQSLNDLKNLTPEQVNAVAARYEASQRDIVSDAEQYAAAQRSGLHRLESFKHSVAALQIMISAFNIYKAIPSMGGGGPGSLLSMSASGSIAVVPSRLVIDQQAWIQWLNYLAGQGLLTASTVGGALAMASPTPPPGYPTVKTHNQAPKTSSGTPASATPTPPKLLSDLAKKRPETAGAGGIASINIQLNAQGVTATTIVGRILPTLVKRFDLERFLGPALKGLDRAHLWGRIIGDEAAAGVLYATRQVNGSIQKRLEIFLDELRHEAAASGGELWLKASNRSHPKAILDGKALAEAEYVFEVRMPTGEVGRRVRVSITDIAPPGTVLTPNRPGYVISVSP